MKTGYYRCRDGCVAHVSYVSRWSVSMYGQVRSLDGNTRWEDGHCWDTDGVEQGNLACEGEHSIDIATWSESEAGVPAEWLSE